MTSRWADLFVLMAGCSFLLSCAKTEDRRTQPRDEFADTRIVNNTALHVHVEQKYLDAEDGFVPVVEILGNVLRPLGFRIVDSDSGHPTLTLRININGAPIGAGYYGAGYRYTGARVSGDWILLDSSGRKEERGSFRASREPIGSLGSKDSYVSGSEAPFDEAFYATTFFEQLALVLERKYGGDAALKYWISVLRNGDIVELAIKSITALGKIHDARSVSALLAESRRDRLLPGDLSAARAERLVESMAGLGKCSFDSLCWVLEAEDADLGSAALAAHALGRMGDTAAVSDLRNALIREKSELHWHNVAVWCEFALYQLGDTAMIDRVASRLDDLNSAPAWALGEIADARAVEALIDGAYATPNALGAYEALQSITGQSFQQHEEWLRWWELHSHEYRDRTKRSNKSGG